MGKLFIAAACIMVLSGCGSAVNLEKYEMRIVSAAEIAESTPTLYQYGVKVKHTPDITLYSTNKYTISDVVKITIEKQ